MRDRQQFYLIIDHNDAPKFVREYFWSLLRPSGRQCVECRLRSVAWKGPLMSRFRQGGREPAARSGPALVRQDLAGEIDGILGPQLVHDVGAMDFHGSLADAETVRGFLVGRA